MKAKAGKDNENKMVVHKELDPLIVELDTSQLKFYYYRLAM